MNYSHGARRRRPTPVLASLAAAAALVAGLTACGSDDDAAIDAAGGTVEVDVTELENDLGTAVDDAVDQAETDTDNLASTLRENGLDSVASVVEQIDVSEIVGEGEFTFFAPNDEAFASLSADDMADLLSDPEQIIETLRNHTLDTTVDAAALATMESVETLAGETLPVETNEDGTVTIGDVTIVSTDIDFSSGVIHVVDGFLLPA